jgi:hypothetical protein
VLHFLLSCNVFCASSFFEFPDAHDLHRAEDIDFEFVYALHNFVATVDGQANAAKGDTMVLLDDSNSYWWLVRIVKDGSIGTMSPSPFPNWFSDSLQGICRLSI